MSTPGDCGTSIRKYGDTIVIDSSDNNNNGWITKTGGGLSTGSDSTNLYHELDPTETWATSKDGFGTCTNTWYNSETDSNVGLIRVDPRDNTLSFFPDIDFTIEWWMKPDNAGGGWDSRIAIKYTGGDYQVTYGNGVMGYGWYSGGWKYFADTTTIPVGEWTHVAICIDRTTSDTEDYIMFVYNGVVQNVVAPPYKGGNWDDKDVYFLNRNAGTESHMYNTQYFGLLDELRISDVCRYSRFGGPLEINWIKRVGNDVKFEFTSVVDTYIIQAADAPGGAWSDLDTVTGDTSTTVYTHTNGLVSPRKKFYRVKKE